MSKILVIPDVHGRPFWHKAVEEIDNVDKVVFLGDYLDPYQHEGINSGDALEEFKAIIKFKQHYSDKVILLYGNHDLPYAFEHVYPSCRYCSTIADEAENLFKLVHFDLVYSQDGYLFSHAGILSEWMNGYELSIDDLLNPNYDKLIPYLLVVDRWRGGFEQWGSCVWGDVRNFENHYTEFQIFGHTQLEKGPIKDLNFACLDCR